MNKFFSGLPGTLVVRVIPPSLNPVHPEQNPGNPVSKFAGLI
jgi:hypothetical protein